MKKGFSLIIVIVILGSILSGALVSSELINRFIKTRRASFESEIAYQAAETGVEKILYFINHWREIPQELGNRVYIDDLIKIMDSGQVLYDNDFAQWTLKEITPELKKTIEQTLQPDQSMELDLDFYGKTGGEYDYPFSKMGDKYIKINCNGCDLNNLEINFSYGLKDNQEENLSQFGCYLNENSGQTQCSNTEICKKEANDYFCAFPGESGGNFFGKLRINNRGNIATAVFINGYVSGGTLKEIPTSVNLIFEGDYRNFRKKLSIDFPKIQVYGKNYNSYSLITAIDSSSTGIGNITDKNGYINCPEGNDCYQSYSINDKVSLEAKKAEGSNFAGWFGACTGTSTCELNMDGDKIVRAKFDQIKYKLTVAKDGTGTGTVVSNPPGINCGSGPDCQEDYLPNTKVSLTANPDPDSEFAGWGGACEGIGPCTVAMNSNLDVTAKFNKIILKTLTITPPIGGVISSQPPDNKINCGDVCRAEYQNGTLVILKATPSENYIFGGWPQKCSGDIHNACQNPVDETCAFTMDIDKIACANFITLPVFTAQLTNTDDCAGCLHKVGYTGTITSFGGDSSVQHWLEWWEVDGSGNPIEGTTHTSIQQTKNSSSGYNFSSQDDPSHKFVPDVNFPVGNFGFKAGKTYHFQVCLENSKGKKCNNLDTILVPNCIFSIEEKGIIRLINIEKFYADTGENYSCQLRNFDEGSTMKFTSIAISQNREYLYVAKRNVDTVPRLLKYPIGMIETATPTTDYLNVSNLNFCDDERDPIVGLTVNDFSGDILMICNRGRRIIKYKKTDGPNAVPDVINYTTPGRRVTDMVIDENGQYLYILLSAGVDQIDKVDLNDLGMTPFTTIDLNGRGITVIDILGERFIYVNSMGGSEGRIYAFKENGNNLIEKGLKNFEADKGKPQGAIGSAKINGNYYVFSISVQGGESKFIGRFKINSSTGHIEEEEPNNPKYCQGYFSVGNDWDTYFGGHYYGLLITPNSYIVAPETVRIEGDGGKIFVTKADNESSWIGCNKNPVSKIISGQMDRLTSICFK